MRGSRCPGPETGPVCLLRLEDGERCPSEPRRGQVARAPGYEMRPQRRALPLADVENPGEARRGMSGNSGKFQAPEPPSVWAWARPSLPSFSCSMTEEGGRPEVPSASKKHTIPITQSY